MKKHIKRSIAAILLAALFILPASAFSDVASGAWYADSVNYCNSQKLMVGLSSSTFGIGQSITLAQVVTLSARLHAQEHNPNHNFSANGVNWYTPYYEYAATYGVDAPSIGKPGENASRGVVARLFYLALKDGNRLTERNSIADQAIPDVATGTPYYEAIYALYRSGITIGKDSLGNYHPNTTVRREEVAAMVARIADASRRQSVTLTYNRSRPRPGTKTLRNLLLTGLQPVGKTMYIWGGGWNEADTGAGTDAVTIGVSAQWEAFFKKQSSSYNYQNYRYQIHNGLDCSGYIGWAVYNVINTENGNAGYVFKATSTAQKYATTYGWGSYTAAAKVQNYRPGDIMSTSGHVYMVVGSCPDGSIVLLHASPAGVQICGTTTRAGSENSKAIQLAKHYMSTYYPAWYAKFPRCSRDSAYLKSYNQMRWDLSGSKLLSDPDGFASMSAEQVLQDLLGE